MTRPISLLLRGGLSALLALALLATALSASAPARIPTYEAGDRVKFSVRTKAANAKRYGVFLTVAAKRKTDRYGVLKRTQVGTFAKMTRRGKVRYQYVTPPYTFPTWFMNRPGRYYWQTTFTDCRVRGCKVVSRIRSFRVVAAPSASE